MYSTTTRYVLVSRIMLEIHLQFAVHHLKNNYVSKNIVLNKQTFYTNMLSLAPQRDDPCNPSPCGSNALCNNGICSCISEYNGDPYRGCAPECVLNSDCPRNRACIRHKCADPCPGSCGQGAICDVINHIPMCSCPPNLQGNAFVQCRTINSMYFEI